MDAPAEFALSADRPFPGLRPFMAADRHFFFGRSAQFYALYRLLNLSRFVAVIGNSGSGKSSLVRAGLLPLLEEEAAEPTGRKWEWVDMRPGDQPLLALTNAMKRLAGTLSNADEPDITSVRHERIAYHLRSSSHGIAKAVGEMDHAAAHSVVLLVDQFEELFRFAGTAPSPTVSAREEARQRDEAAHFVQLLLEASRSPNLRIHVIITLRSDFIGDCARFQGLPEAVSATQYLVPSLTRDQREEVITRPIVRAGAEIEPPLLVPEIEPALVERLLNDSGDELPVLQHCLLRLWVRAGLRNQALAGTPEHRAGGRRITTHDYEEIEGIAGALSQHADEILTTDLQGLDDLVSRVFRALSELDRDGRATRRALSFGQLAAETAIDEATLRVILDRFRADDCSFLTPSPSTTPVLDSGTRIDVGHEALLRHWERVSGVPGATGEKADARLVGWLREEHHDGERYQVLLAMASGGDAETELLSSDQVRRYWRWWHQTPRTAAWAERYGGGHDKVERLLRDSKAADEKAQRERLAEQEDKRRSRIFRYAAGVLAVLLIAALGGGSFVGWQWTKAKVAAELATQTTRAALRSLENTVDRIKEGLTSGTIKVSPARDLLSKIVDDLANVPGDTNDLISSKANILIALSDAFITIGSSDKALSQAQSALEMGERLVKASPENLQWQKLLYSSHFRIADARLKSDRSEEAIRFADGHYRAAVIVAERLSAAEPTRGDRLFDLAFIYNKIAEMYQTQKDFPAALTQFNVALEYAKRAAAINPDNITWQSYTAANYGKISTVQIRLSPPDFTGALLNLDQAISTLKSLSARFPENNIVLSNLARAYRSKGEALVLRWQPSDFDAALDVYKVAIELVTSLIANDPSNATWRASIAPTYARLAETYEKHGDLTVALDYYRVELEAREWLVKNEPDNKIHQKNRDAAAANVARLDVQPPPGPPPLPGEIEAAPPP